MIFNDIFGIPIKCPLYYDDEIQWDEPQASVHEGVQSEPHDEQVGDSEHVQEGSECPKSQPVPISVIRPKQPQHSLALSTIPGKNPIEATIESSRSTVAPELQEFIQQHIQTQIQSNNVVLLQEVFKMIQDPFYLSNPSRTLLLLLPFLKISFSLSLFLS